MIVRRGAFEIMFLLTFVLLINFSSAEKLGIDIDNNYVKTGEINFKITLYDDDNFKIDEEVDYQIRNYYTDVIKEGKAISGEEINFKLPDNVDPRPWEISASYNGVRTSEKFNIGELKKIEISLEKDELVIRNAGNTDYEGHILIYIGEKDNTANIFLSRGQTKKIRLTAPEGEYYVRVDTGDEEEIVFQGVSLTGNVVGLERIIEGSFLERYPIVSLFLAALVVVIVFILVLKRMNKK